MTRRWLAGAAAFAMMTGAAFAQGMSSGSSAPTPSTASPGSGAASSSTASAGAASSAPANPAVTNYGTGGMQPLPASPPEVGTGTH